MIVGLDLSLTSTGVCRWQRDGRYDTQVLKSRASVKGHARLFWIMSELRHVTDGAKLAVVEGPAYGAKGSAYHQLAGLWWLVTHQLWLWQIPTAIASPAAVKTYATGKGNAGKDIVLSAVIRRWPGFEGGNDEADALVLAALGAEHLGYQTVPVPQSHQGALQRVEWPSTSEKTE